MASRPRTAPALALLLLAAGLAGCAQPQPTPNATPDGTDAGNDTREDPPPRDGVAWDRLPGSGEVPEADAARLVDLVERQVYENGTPGQPRYRTPGTPGHEAAVPVLESILAEAGARVETERFTVELPELGEVNATNVYGVREGSSREIWLAAHWDSRAWADQAANESRREWPVLGANDGAAGVAVVAHALELMPETDATIRVALFDVEDQGRGGEGWIQGSTHAAQRLGEDGRSRIEALLLVDMPAHDPLSVPREGRSENRAPQLADAVFGVAERLEARGFANETGPAILDDHVPFLQGGVRAIDLVHLDDNGTSAFPWTWHTPHDTVEHVSGDSMATVTRVVVGATMAVDRGALPAEG